MSMSILNMALAALAALNLMACPTTSARSSRTGVGADKVVKP